MQTDIFEKIRKSTGGPIGQYREKAALTKDNVLRMFKEILESTEDEIKTSVEKIEPIREEDEYGGFRLMILCRFENIRVVLPVDIATGDVVTPAPVEYAYKKYVW